MANELNIRKHVTAAGMLSMYHSMFPQTNGSCEQESQRMNKLSTGLHESEAEGEGERCIYLSFSQHVSECFSRLIYCHHVRCSRQAKRILKCHNAIATDKRLQRVNHHFYHLSNSQCILFRLECPCHFFVHPSLFHEESQ